MYQLEWRKSMGIFNQMLRGGSNMDSMQAKEAGPIGYKPRTFKQTIEDQIAHHKSKVAELEAVRDSMTPEIEKFVEAMQKLG